jgi:hypothetical protein
MHAELRRVLLAIIASQLHSEAYVDARGIEITSPMRRGARLDSVSSESRG